MKVSKLIEALQAMPPDLEVYGYCDHGQTPEKVCNPSVCITEELVGTLYDGWSVEGDDSEGYTERFVLL